MIPNQPKKQYLASEVRETDYSKDVELKKFIKDESLKIIKEYLHSTAFTTRKITDTPTDSLEVVNRKYVTLNGLVGNRPTSSVAVIGQSYFASDTGIPMTYSAGGWRNGTGSIVASA